MKKHESLEERLTILMGPTEKDLLRELAYLRRDTMGRIARDAIRAELMQSGLLEPKPTEEQEADLLKVAP